MTKIKICGLKRTEDISYVNELLPDLPDLFSQKAADRSMQKKQQN